MWKEKWKAKKWIEYAKAMENTRRCWKLSQFWRNSHWELNSEHTVVMVYLTLSLNIIPWRSTLMLVVNNRKNRFSQYFWGMRSETRWKKQRRHSVVSECFIFLWLVSVTFFYVSVVFLLQNLPYECYSLLLRYILFL